MEVQVETVRLGKSGLPEVAEAVAEIAAEADRTPARVALAWLLSRPGVTAPIARASRPEQLEDSAAAVGLELSSDHLDRLDRVSQPFI
jgi:aryl-alcohol dehydrogenase-like predicted oxidoreductase